MHFLLAQNGVTLASEGEQIDVDGGGPTISGTSSSDGGWLDNSLLAVSSFYKPAIDRKSGVTDKSCGDRASIPEKLLWRFRRWA